MLLRIALSTLGYVYDDNEQLEDSRNVDPKDNPYFIDNEEICDTKFVEQMVQQNSFDKDDTQWLRNRWLPVIKVYDNGE